MSDWSQLPELPEKYFFRISRGWFLGKPTVQVQVRREWHLGPLRWSTRDQKNWSTREIMTDPKGNRPASDQEVAWRIARIQATDLWARLRPVELGELEGDHR